jgi:WD40 repeat protein
MMPALKVLSLFVFLLIGHPVYSQDSRLVPQTSHVNGIKTAALSPDGTFFVSAGFDNLLKVWDYKTGKLLRNIKTEAAVVNSILFIDNSNFVTGDSKGYVTLQSLDSKKSLLKRKISNRQINGIVYDKTGNVFWCAGYGGLLQAVDADSFNTTFEMKNLQIEINASSFLPEKDILLLASTSGKLYIFDTKIKSLIDSSEIFSTDVSGVCGYNGGTEVAASSFGGEIKFFNFDRMTGLKQTGIISTQSNSMVTSLSISHSGNTLAATTFDNDIHLIDTKSKSTKSVIHAHEYIISGFGFLDDNNGFSYSFGNRTFIWEFNKPSSPVREIAGVQGDIVHFGMSKGILIYSTSDGSVYNTDLTKSFSTNKLFQSFSSITALALDTISKSVVIGEADGTVTILNILTGDQVFNSRLHSKEVLALEMNADFLISSSADKTVKIIPTLNLNVEAVSPIKLTSRFTSIGYNKKIQLLALGSEEGLIYFVNPFNGNKESTLAGHTAPVNSLEFTADGNFLLSTGVDKTIRVWNNNDLFNFKTWQNNSGVAYSGRFLTNDVIIATGDGGRVMKFEFKNDSVSFFEEGSQTFFNLVKVDDSSIAALSAEGIIYIWDLQSKQFKYLLYLKNEQVTILDVDQNIIFTSSDKNEVFQPATDKPAKIFEIKPLNGFKFKF